MFHICFTNATFYIILFSMSTTATNIRIDSQLKSEVTPLFEGLGLSLSQAITLFLRQSVLHNGLPFKVEYPEYSKELLSAVEEAKKLENSKETTRYTDMEKMWADLDK